MTANFKHQARDILMKTDYDLANLLLPEGPMNTEGDHNLRLVENPNAPLIYADGVAGCVPSRDGTLWLTLYNIVQEMPSDPKQKPEMVKRVAARVTLSNDAAGALTDFFDAHIPVLEDDHTGSNAIRSSTPAEK